MAQSPIAATSNQQQRPGHPQIFEFTKRKKWADILVAELPESVLFILDSGGRIQYAGAGANEILGWNAEELAERDVVDLVNDDDKKSFRERLQASLGTEVDLACYARLRCKTGASATEQGANLKELLFEIRGHALRIADDVECKCFFFMAKPYPSRNMAILNTFLELKIENERLTQRLNDLKFQQEIPQHILQPFSSSTAPLPNAQLMHTPYALSGSSEDVLLSPTTRTGYDARIPGSTNLVQTDVSSTNARDEDEDEGGKRKKLKKTHPIENEYVCVTCGRTDSPEWRKGPKGPKTLCNACGLRWAKRAKKADETSIPIYGQAQDSSRAQATGSGSGSSRHGAPVAHAALSVTPTSSTGSSASSLHNQHNQHGEQAHAKAVPAPSPIQMSVSQVPSLQLQTASMTMPDIGPYPVHSSQMPGFLHYQGITPTPPHGYPPTRDQFQGTYDPYTWAVNQQHSTYPGY
ncbi:hypothetical protein DFH11DRAFT_1146438 [Phellopilus nigrolimitatus]|nr:hypothetical protein DFH11DRAFT_1146438 [Phellopilus nigrolimitatus]